MAKGGKITGPLAALRETLKLNPAFQAFAEGTKAVDENGFPMPVYHGSNRVDRFEQGIKPERATSGPMPFFSTDPTIASNYASGKIDNSLDDTGYEHWFTYRPKGSRTDQPLSRMWWDLTPEQRQSFNAKMRHIGTNEDTGEIEDQAAVGGGVAPSHWDWLVSQQNGEHRGNGLSAAVDMWLQSANLYNDEGKFLDALRLAGLDTSKVKFTDYKSGAPGVLPAFISAKNPLVTSAIPPEVVETLQDAADRQRRKGSSEREFMRGVDPWDKNYKDPDDWMEALREGVEEAAKGGNPGHAWTSIPDWVTKTLRGLGYDSIHDVGGKMGGDPHDVWIPFDVTQVKSPFNKGTFDPTKKDINKARGGRIAFAKGGRIQELRNLATFLKGSQAPRKLYHGTTHDISAFSDFDPIWMAESPRTAGQYADRQAFGNREGIEDEDYRSTDEYSPQFDKVEPAGQNVMPLHASIKKPLDLTDMGAATTIDEAIGQLQEKGFLKDVDESNYRDVVEELESDLSTGDTEVRYDTTYVPVYRLLEGLNVYPEIKAAGYDGLKLIDTDVHGRPHESWAAFGPTQVKSSIGNEGTFDPTNPTITKAKGGKITIPRTELDALREYAHGLTPQMGMFSTLDQLVQQAPFEKGSSEQWQGYLKPGRMLQRDEMQFPLKQEELDFSKASSFLDQLGESLQNSILPDKNISKDELLASIRKNRPAFGQTMRGYPNSVLESPVLPKTWSRPEWNVNETPTRVTTSPSVSYGPNYDERMAHQTPDSIYQEAITRLEGLNYPSHFGNDATSWALTSSHDLPNNERLRLIEEIQADAAQDAATRLEHDPHFYMDEDEKAKYKDLTEQSIEFSKLPPGEWRDTSKSSVDAERNALWEEAAKRIPRRGYRTPEDEQLLEQTSTGDNAEAQKAARERVPDVPFKDPADYGRLEMKKQLLNAADEGDDYVALVNPEDLIERYSLSGKDADAMRHIYGGVYRKEMTKLAKQYGAEMVEVPLKTKTGLDIRPEAMRDVGAENMDDFIDAVYQGRYYGRHDPYHDVIDSITAEFPDSPQVSDAAHRAQQAVAAWDAAQRNNEDTSDELMDLSERMNNLYSIYKDRMGSGMTKTKTFQAIKTTPEVRERIKRIGTSLFSVGAGVAPFVGPTQEQAEEPAGFAKGGKIVAPRTALDTLREFHEAAAPQLGMFSTLDKLVEGAPFERGSHEQWRNYLKPGRPFEREGVQFPLKKEELDYALNPILEARLDPTETLDKRDLLDWMRAVRPRFSTLFAGPEQDAFKTALQLGNEKEGMGTVGPAEFMNPAYGPDRSPTLSHQTPGSIYEESMTRLKNLNYRTHYTPDTLSHSRTSSHDVDVQGEHGKLRLIEEIQSDLHQDAAEKERGQRTPEESREYGELQQHFRQLQSELETPGLSPETSREITQELSDTARRRDELANMPETRRTRRGYMSPAELAEFRDLDQKRNEVSDSRNGSPLWTEGGETDDRWTPAMRDRRDELGAKLNRAVPDAPFKDAADYARLEIKKQLLNAANNGEDWLALTNPEDQIARYGLEGSDADAMHHIYGGVYPKEMEKIAKQYGLPMGDVPLKTSTHEDTRPPIMAYWGEETPRDFVDRVIHRDNTVDIHTLLNELADGAIEPGYTDMAHGVATHFEKAESARKKLEEALADQEQANHMDTHELLGLDEDEDLHETYSRRELEQEKSAAHQRYADQVKAASDKLVEHLDPLYEHWNTLRQAEQTADKTFRGIKLSPEDRERLKRIGTSLFSVGAGAAPFVGPLQEQQDEPQQEQPQTFAEGGTVAMPTTEQGMLEPGNLDPWKRPVLNNPDGSYSTTSSASFNFGGKEVLIPTVVNGKRLSKVRPDGSTDYSEAIDHYRKTGEHLGVFDTPENADRYAQSLHEAQAKKIDEEADYSENPFAHHSKKEEQSQLDELRNLAMHFGLGAKTPWMHYEPGHGVGEYETPGTAQPFLHYKEGAVNDKTPVDPETGMLLAPMEISKPDLVDELASLPELLTAGHGPQFSKRASERSQSLDEILREDMGIKPPSTFLEYLAEAGGGMAGQLPTGDMGAGIRALTGAAKLTGPLRHLAKIPAAAAEWFSPTIVPSARNYLHGTAAGTAIMEGLPKLTEALRGPNKAEAFNKSNEDIEQDVRKAPPDDEIPPVDMDQEERNRDFLNTFITGN